jgi:fibro-slime domain-containing protein
LPYLSPVRLLLLLAACAPALAADPYLALKVRYYDHDYGDFGGEFASSKVAGCANDPNNIVRGMVQDTLVFDAAKGKKYPRPGLVDNCSSQLEKWFDPSASRTAACGTLFFRNVGDTLRPVWKFDSKFFFPVDSISPQRSVTLPNGSVVANDYAYCMEINAALDYAGGETLKIGGDDDTWVFLDGRLAVDQGGVHFAKEETIALDTLPFLKGKAGRSLDLDVYYCSRQPATATFAMEAAARLRPLPLKSLQISDTLGRPLTSNDVLVGKSRICARANYQVAGEEQCGNYQPPPDLSFLNADWDLNGKPMSIEGGQSCLELDPATFPDRTRLTLTARSSGLVSRITVLLVRPARFRSGSLAGKGRAERVELSLDSAGGSAPSGLEAVFEFAGARRWAWVMPDPARPGVLSGELAGGNRGPWGVTSFPSVIAATQETVYGKTISDSVGLSDGIGPALTAAALHWGGKDDLRPAWLELEASEALGGGGDSVAAGLDWKRAGAGWAGPKRAPAPSDRADRILLDLTLEDARLLKAGDSVSLSPRIRDQSRNAAGSAFVPILVPRDPEMSRLKVRVRPDPARGRAFVPQGGAGRLIPVDAAGHPLDPAGPDAGLAAAGGPVLELRLPVPPERIHLFFHDHLGGFVNEAERGFSDAEWESMRKASPGDTVTVRLLWYPVARNGNRLATGAYIAQGRLWTREGPVKGPDGATVELGPTRLAIPPRLFGFLRE